MSFGTPKELPEKQRSGERAGSIENVHVYQVIATVKTDTASGARTAAGIPTYGSVHPSADGTVVTGKEASLTAKLSTGGARFEVTVTYSTPQYTAFAADPWDRPAEFADIGEESAETYFEDKTSPTPLKCTTKAGEPFDPMLERPAAKLGLTITKNAETWARLAGLALWYTTNDAAVTIDGTVFATGTLLLKPINSRSMTEVVNGVTKTYKQLTFTLLANPDGWNRVVENRGWRDTAGKILDAKGQPPDTPWPLDASGVRKANATDAPTTLTFKPFAAASWALITPYFA
jgi:hypothetical protein